VQKIGVIQKLAIRRDLFGMRGNARWNCLKETKFGPFYMLIGTKSGIPSSQIERRSYCFYNFFYKNWPCFKIGDQSRSVWLGGLNCLKITKFWSILHVNCCQIWHSL
jgi:hypothetical protein